MTHVAVVGGGLAGLTAAHRLGTHGLDVTVIEASPWWGGQVRTRREAGTIVEDGAEGFSATGREVRMLCEELDLADRIIGQSLDRTLALGGTGLSELHSGVAGWLAGIQASPESFGAGLLTLRNGLGGLIEALLAALTGPADLLNETTVHRIVPEGNRWLVEGDTRLRLKVDAIVLAVPARAMARLLNPILGHVEALTTLELRSSVTVSQLYPRTAVAHPLDATGFVVTEAREVSGLRACTFCSSKFRERVAEGWCLVRGFFRPRNDEEIEASDTSWSQKLTMTLAPILGVEEKAHRSWVSRWPDALPHYSPGFESDMVRLHTSLAAARLDGLELAGAALEGGGVVGAVRSGERAGNRVLTGLAD